MAIRTRAVSALAVFALTVPTLAAVPAAHAEEAPQVTCNKVDSGSVDWGLRASFLSYLKMKNFKASYSFNGQENPEKLIWEVKDAPIEVDSASKAVIPLKGEFKGQSHPAGDQFILDMALSDGKLHVDGKKGFLTFDVKYRPLEGEMVQGAPAQPFKTKNDVKLVEFDLNEAANFKEGEVALHADKTVVTADGNEVFGGNYGADNNTFAPLDGTFAVSKSTYCKPPAGNDPGSSAGNGALIGILAGLGVIGAIIAALMNFAGGAGFALPFLPR